MKVGFIIPDREMPWDSVHQGIGYVAAYALKHSTISECEVFRTYNTTQEEVLNFITKEWDVIGLSLTNPALDETANIVEDVKRNCNAKIVLGGSEVTTLEENILNRFPSVDYAVYGEGEITFSELLNYINGDKKDVSNITGLIYRGKEGQIHKNQPRKFTSDLDIFPYPDRTLFTYPYNFHSIIGTRGCPFRCTFCNSSANWGHQYRLRNPKKISEEIQYILSLYGNKRYFSFNDDAFNINKAWVLEVCEELKKLNITWNIRGFRADKVTNEIADSLLESGCTGVACGVESANNKALSSMRKATTIENILQGVKILRSRGLNVNGQFIIGNQGDTYETVMESIEFAKHFTESTFGIAYPLPHTELYDYITTNNYLLPDPVPIKYKGKIIDWILFDTPHFSAGERLAAVDKAIQAEVYHNINYLSFKRICEFCIKTAKSLIIKTAKPLIPLHIRKYLKKIKARRRTY